MHPLYDYIEKQLAERLKARKVVVWYDVRREFAPFIAQLRGGVRTTDEAVPVTVSGAVADGTSSRIATMSHSDVSPSKGRATYTAAAPPSAP